jgi:hypothetical protein
VSSYPTRLITGQPKRGVGDIDWLSASPKWLIFARPRSSDRATFTNYSGVIYQAIESAEPFYGEFQQRFGVGRTCGVRSVKRDVRAQFYFESFPFFARTTTKNHFGAFFDETSDDPFSYPSGTSGNDGNLVSSLSLAVWAD